MKHIYTLFLILSSALAFGQIPANYYDSANGLTGYALKTELRNITANGHSSQSYDDLYNGYIETHSDINVTGGANYENDGTILDFYSENPSGNDPYNYTHGNDQCGNQSSEGDCYNREHLVPQSSFNSNFPMQSDIHHVIPTDGRVNNFRGSLPFGNVASPNWTSLNGSRRGSSDVVGYSGTMFEPIDEFKGDIARALLYFAVRYENTVDGYTSFDMFNGTNDQVFETWAIDLLLDWHYNVDPVDQREIERNNAAYDFQGNANPFVDHPEYANLIWNPTPDTTAPSNPTNLVASNPTDTTVDLSWTASTDNIGVDSYDIYIDGVFAYNTVNTVFTVSGLTPDTSYCFEVLAKDAAGNESGFSNEECETTTNNGSSGGDVDIFFSEYIEGSSSNKVLEIANFTGSTVTLSSYTLKLSANGNNSWQTTYNFPPGAEINNQDVYVIANGGSAVCTSEYDDLNSSITAYNGNDAIGLFKNDVLIDILGTLGDNSVYAENTTLIRNVNIDSPNTTFTISEWSTASSNNCDDLGSHSQTLSLNNSNIEKLSMYPNPNYSNTLHFNYNEDLNITVYDILGKQVLAQNLDSNNLKLNVSNLKKGVYLVKIESNSQVITKKLIKQ